MIHACALSLLLAILAYPALSLGRRVRSSTLTALATAILLTPLLIPPIHRFGRLLAAIWAVALACKLRDLHVGASLGHRPRFRTFLAFLPNLASCVLRKLDREPAPTTSRTLLRLTRSLAVAIPLQAAFVALYRMDWWRWPFACEHVAKAATFFPAVFALGTAGACLLRLVGMKAREPMLAPLLATTPADFWRRYNRPAAQFFLEDIFRPLGGSRSPVRASLATFAASAALHEYLFDVAAGHLLGYQVAFFLIQGVAATATIRARPRGGRAAVGWAATLAFNAATSWLFLAGLDAVVPFYAARSSR